MRDGTLLWDVDGTLVRWSDHTERQSPHREAVKARYGECATLKGTSRGLTDYELLRSLLPEAASPSSTDFMSLLSELDRICLRQNIRGSLEANLDLVKVACRLGEIGWRNVLLTGNTNARARWKLSSVDLQELFEWDHSTFGDRTVPRSALCAAAVKSCRSAFGATIPIVVVGDSRRDILAAQASGVPVVATTWGGDSADALHSWGADYVTGIGGFNAENLIRELQRSG